MRRFDVSVLFVHHIGQNSSPLRILSRPNLLKTFLEFPGHILYQLGALLRICQLAWVPEAPLEEGNAVEFAALCQVLRQHLLLNPVLRIQPHNLLEELADGGILSLGGGGFAEDAGVDLVPRRVEHLDLAVADDDLVLHALLHEYYFFVEGTEAYFHLLLLYLDLHEIRENELGMALVLRQEGVAHEG